jgi:sigma-B regulation protein RsbU (phosphoserine phosphatase)
VWTAILGDVSGKGAKAASITAAARHTLRTAALIDPNPIKNLELLNRILISDAEVGEFCTVVYARLCPARNSLSATIAHAGHPPSLVLRHSGSVEVLCGGRGPLVGVYPEAQFTSIETKLQTGELLLLYTDGVTEARPSDVAFGERELMATLAAHGARPAHDVAEAIKTRALELQDGIPRDDIAILAIRIAQ